MRFPLFTLLACTLLSCFTRPLVAVEPAPPPAPGIPRVDLTAVTPLPLTNPPSAEAKALIERLLNDPTKHGGVLTSTRDGMLVLKLNKMTGVQPGMEMITFRRNTISGVLRITDATPNDVCAWPIAQYKGVALGDKAILRDDYALPTPLIYWEGAPRATEYRVQRRVRGEEQWTVVYTGAKTSYADPDLPEALRKGTVYEYQVGAYNAGGGTINTTICSNHPCPVIALSQALGARYGTVLHPESTIEHKRSGTLDTLTPALLDAPPPAPGIPRVDLTAVTPLPLTNPPSAEAQALLERLFNDPTRHGVVLDSGRWHETALRVNDMIGIQPGTELVAFRRQFITGVIRVTRVGAFETSGVTIDRMKGVALGDKIIPREDYALPTPLIYWEGAQGATAYRLQRRIRGEEPWTVVYTGAKTSFVDPDLPNATQKGVVYEYQVSACHDGGEILNPTICNSDPRRVVGFVKELPADSLWARTLDIRAKAKDPNNLTAILALLKDEEPPIRNEALRALAAMKDPRAVEPLIKLLAQKPPYGYEIGVVLRAITGMIFYDDTTKWRAWWKANRDRLLPSATEQAPGI